ncbi:MAG: hypothetical protein R3F62_29795 [Planctomycetota bacterium]
MTVPITRYVRGYRQPTRLRISCVRRMLEFLADSGVDELVEQAREALAADGDLLDQEERWSASRSRGTHAPGARELDVELDRELQGAGRRCWSHGAAFAGAPRGAAAVRLRERLFPSGVFEVTKLPYLQQEVAVAALLRLAGEDPQLAADAGPRAPAQALGKLARLNARYKRAGDRGPREPTWAELRARAALQARALLLAARDDRGPGARARGPGGRGARGRAGRGPKSATTACRRLRRRRRSSQDPDLDPPVAADPAAWRRPLEGDAMIDAAWGVGGGAGRPDRPAPWHLRGDACTRCAAADASPGIFEQRLRAR